MIEQSGKMPEYNEMIDSFNNSCIRVFEEKVNQAYYVTLSPHLLDINNLTFCHYLREASKHGRKRIHLLLTPSVLKHYKFKIESYLCHHAVSHTWTFLKKRPYSEYNKSFESLGELARCFANHSPLEGEVIVLFGGGVLSDVGGLLAALWRRGAPFISVPTTLLAAVDAAISPKTAVNLDDLKNALGVYYPPYAVLIDPAFFKTTERSSLMDGIAEMIKVATMADRALFEDLNNKANAAVTSRFQTPEAVHLLWQAVKLFLKLRSDPRSRGHQHSIRSFGHVFSRLLESQSKYSLSHGQAVTLEMRVAVNLAKICGVLNETDRTRILQCYDNLELIDRADVVKTDTIWSSVFESMNTNGFDFPVPAAIGQSTYLRSFSKTDLHLAIQHCRNWDGNGDGEKAVLPPE